MHLFQLIRQPIILALTGAVMISFSAVFVKLAEVSPTASAFYRVFFGFLFLLAATLWRGELRRVSLRQSGLIVFCGITFALDLFFWHRSILYIGPGLATIISNFQVFVLTVIGVLFFAEKIRSRFVFAVPLAFAGLVFIIGGNWSGMSADYKTGIYFGLLTALCYSAFLLGLRAVQGKGRQTIFSALMLISLCTAIFLGAGMVALGDSFHIPDPSSLLALLGLGLCSQTIGWVMIAGAIHRIRASLIGLILLLQPALSFVWDVLLFARPTDLLNWTGVLLTLGAIYMGSTAKAAKE